MTEEEEKSLQILKCRDDKAPVLLSKVSGDKDAVAVFKVAKGSGASWLKNDEHVGPEKLRPRIEPWLTALFQSEYLSLVVGSGLTHAIHWMAAGEGLSGMTSVAFTQYAEAIEAAAAKTAQATGRGSGNFEDRIRIASELLRGLEVAGEKNKKCKTQARTLRNELSKVIKDFAESILAGEHGIITAAPGKAEDAVNYLVSFLMSFASRTGTRERLHIFTTNYDRCIEMGAEVAGLHLLDRFVGSLAPLFRSSRLDVDMHYNPPGIRGEPRYVEGVARFTKLHGSVDWVDIARSIRRIGVPFGAEHLGPYLQTPGPKTAKALRLMIYPNSAKDRETAAYPYVELFRDFAAAVCRPNSTVITYGYSFGDEHVNRVIEDMLTIPSTHLVVISYDDPLGRIMDIYKKREAQITLLIGNHLGDFQSLVDNYLPKPAIDRATFRMAELLKARWGTIPSAETGSPGTENGNDK